MEFKDTTPIPLGLNELEHEVIEWLMALIRGTEGKDTREPIHWLLRHAEQDEDEVQLKYTHILNEFTKYVLESTTNTEVRNARGSFQLLHERIEDLDFKISLYEQWLGGNLNNTTQEYANVQLNFTEV